MAGVLLVHVVSRRKVSSQELPDVLTDIETNNRLLAGGGRWGYGVYAYLPGTIPSWHAGDPLVVFEVDEALVSYVGPASHPFAFIRVPFREANLRIDFNGFVAAPPGFRSYAGNPIT